MAIALMAVLATLASAGIGSDVIAPMKKAADDIAEALKTVAVPLGALVITIAGFKWVGSADDAGARKQAKDMIINALVGIMICYIAPDLVSLMTG